MNIVFMGTPEFAVTSLDILIQNNHHILAIVTAPDRPAGRGQKVSPSAVKQYGLSRNIRILQPENLKEKTFIRELKALNPDVIIVVAFRMLPKEVWAIPVKGTFNLHASLLPQYRGAAPINWAIINGETQTGVTTFFIDEKIDTGNIILQESIEILKNETAGELHDRLMNIGAILVLETVNLIETDKTKTISQSDMSENTGYLKSAPKIFKTDCKINWNDSGKNIYNKIRGLSPYPGAFTGIIFDSKKAETLKIFKADFHTISQDKAICTDYKTYLNIRVDGGVISILELQLSGRIKMNIQDFLRGTHFKNVQFML